MYVVFTAVEILPGTTEDGAVKDLKDQLIPQIFMGLAERPRVDETV